MRVYLSALLLVLSIFSGCGKKKKPKIQKRPEMAASFLRGPVDEYVFDDSSKIKDFDFVEEDGKSGSFVSENDVTEQLLREELGEDELAFSEYYDDLGDLAFDNVQFDFDSNKLAKGQQEKLHRNIEAARRASNKDNKVEVRAYCCEIGPQDYNMALSQKRANAIKNEMVAHGIPSEKVNAVGRGQEYQVAWSNSNNRKTRIKELAPNRRAEMSVSPNL